MRLTRTAGAVGVAVSGALAWAMPAAADPLPTSAEHIETPGRSLASDDTADALVNPANLAWLPAARAPVDLGRCPDEAVKVGCGTAWSVGTPLPFGLFDGPAGRSRAAPWGAPTARASASPTEGTTTSGSPGVSPPSWASARRSECRSTRSYSQEAVPRRALRGVTAGAVVRPDPHFAFTAVARDFNRPSSTLLPPSPARRCPCSTGATPWPLLSGQPGAGASSSGSNRNTGRARTSGSRAATSGWTSPGWDESTASVEAAHLGNGSERGSSARRAWSCTFAGSAPAAAPSSATVSAAGAAVGEYVTASIAGYTQPGIPRRARAVWIRIERRPATRGHVALLRRLWQPRRRRATSTRSRSSCAPSRRARSPTPRSSPTPSACSARAARRSSARSRTPGPRRSTFARAPTASSSTPAGGMRYAGLRSQYIYLKGLLDKIGVQGRVRPRSARTRARPSSSRTSTRARSPREDHVDMLRKQEAVFVRNLSLYRHMSEERVREVTRNGPFVAHRGARRGSGRRLRLRRRARARDQGARRPRRSPTTKYEDETKRAGRRSARGAQGRHPLPRRRHRRRALAAHPARSTCASSARTRWRTPSSELREDADRARGRPSHREPRRLVARERRHVARAHRSSRRRSRSSSRWAAVAASGGYYVASASQDIYALPLTMTGSIGVFYGKADVSGLLAKIGVTIDTYKTAPRADAESLFRGFTPDEEQRARAQGRPVLRHVPRPREPGRGMTKAEVDAVGRGRVWTGQQAIERHLVDHLGGLREALEAARGAAHLPDDAPIVESPTAARDVSLEQSRSSSRAGGERSRRRGARRAATRHQEPRPRRGAARVLYTRTSRSRGWSGSRPETGPRRSSPTPRAGRGVPAGDYEARNVRGS